MANPHSTLHPSLLVIALAMASACAAKSKSTAASPEPTAGTEPAAVTEPVAAEEPVAEPAAGPDNSALIAALDALDAEIESCHGKLGTKTASECADAISAAVANLGEPIQSSAAAADVAGGHQEIQTHADKLAKAAKGGKHKDQHHHLDDIARLSKDMRSKL